MRPFLRLLTATVLLALTASAAMAGTVSVDPFSRTVDTSRLRVQFDNDHADFVRLLYFKDWSSLNDLAGEEFSGIEFFGQTLRGVDSTGYINLALIEDQSWQVTSNSDVFAEIVIQSTSEFQPPVTTTYHFWADVPYFEVIRVVHFASMPDSSDYQGFVPRMSFLTTYHALRWRDTEGDTIQRGFCYGGCTSPSWDGHWIEHVNITGTRGFGAAQIYTHSMPAGTPLVRGYGPGSFSGWCAPLAPATYRAADDTTRLLFAFSNDPANYAGWDSLWAGYDNGSFALAVPPASAPGSELRLTAAPNPSRAGTRIAWTLPASGRVRLEVLDVSGRRVARLEDGFALAGPHSVTWSGRDAAGGSVAPGVYFASLVTAKGSRLVRLARVR